MAEFKLERIMNGQSFFKLVLARCLEGDTFDWNCWLEVAP